MIQLKANMQLIYENLILDIENLSTEQVKLLVWNTFLDAPYVNGFSVFRNGSELDYVGAHYKRVFDPTYSLLDLKETEIKTFKYPIADIVNSFHCENVSNGDIIKISLSNTNIEIYDEVKSNAENSDVFTEYLISCNDVIISSDIILRAYKKKDVLAISSIDSEFQAIPLCVFGHNSGFIQLGPTSAHILGYPVTSGLNVNQIKIIKDIVRVIYDNKTKINNVTNSALFSRWFGSYSTVKADLVKRVLQRVNLGACPSYIIFNDTSGICKGDVYAKIFYDPNYNNSPKQCSATVHYCHKLLLCPLFWTRPLRGQDSKVGTIIHELTHGYSYTKDHKYGKTACLTLAKQDPAKALENADSFEYYCEELIN